MRPSAFPLPFALAAPALLALAACGGGDGSSSPATPDTPATPTAVTLTGKVIGNQGVKGATVCLDLNANKACDTGEPVSAVTGTDGAYSLTTDPTKTTAAQAAAAPFVALIPTQAVDAADPTSTLTTRALAFTAPAGKGAQINPLTTLVQTGIAAGLSQAAAETAIAVQLGIAATDIYDYQAQAAVAVPFTDNARLMAQAVIAALEAGVAANVVDVAAAGTPSSQLISLNYTDASNYTLRQYDASDEKGTGKSRVLDKRSGLTAGAATSDAVLYQSAYLSPTGWVRCDATGFLSTRGTPSRSAFCAGGQNSAGYTVETDIAGKAMGEVIRGMQAATDGSNSITMNASLVDNVVFPAGSKINMRTNVILGQPVFVNNLNSTNEILTGASNASLEAFIKARPNTSVNLSTNAGLTWLGFTGDANHWLAGAFLDETSKVQYYSCTFKSATNTFDVCTLSTQGTFKVVTQNGARLIKFSGQPAPVDSINYTVGYGEYSAGVMARFRETKADERYLVTNSARLNGTAWDALRKALNL